MNEPSYTTRLIHAFAIGLVISATLTLIEPAKVAMFNWEEFSVAASDMARLLIRPFVIVAFAFAACSVPLSWLSSRRYVALLAALLICLWAQGNLLVWEYGDFDGEAIDWGRHLGKGLFEAALWMSILLLALIRPEILQRRALAIAGTVSALQLLSIAGIYYENAPFAEKRTAAAEHPEQHAQVEASVRKAILSYSRSRNVIIIVLDAFQSDFFAELMNDTQFAADAPPGFVYHRNAVAPYETTLFSLQSILTSETPGTYVSLSGWQVDEMRRSVPAQLAERGHDVALLSWTPSFLACNYAVFGYECLSQHSANSMLEHGDSRKRAGRERVEEALLLLGVASFRLAPHFVKPWVYNAGNWRIPEVYGGASAPIATDPRVFGPSKRDLATFEAMIGDSFAVDERPTFKFFHFFGIHPPSTLTRECGWNGMEIPRASSVADLVRTMIGRDTPARQPRDRVVDSSACVLSRMFDFLRKLDEIGVYDNSLIFVLGDHGRRFSPVDPTVAAPPLPGAQRPRQGKAGTDGPALQDPARGLPLFLVKRMGARFPMEISDVPVSLCDVPRSIFSELNMPNDFSCESIFDSSGERESVRTHYRVGFLSRKVEVGDVLEAFVVRGHSWSSDSWQRADRGAGQ